MQSARFAEKFHNAKWSKNIKLQHTQKGSQNVAERTEEEEDGEEDTKQKKMRHCKWSPYFVAVAIAFSSFI